ncbi:hypothetical protein Syun_013943 [Stephania yunnanensis]|uniref:Uncharacterized protein n=1 Tax=Stephania yunnanensis TaxID=152371 RepID=A0AAP0JK30_9MAGN
MRSIRWSTGVKLGRWQCRCASRGVVAEDTRNSVKEFLTRATAAEEPGASSGGKKGSRGGGKGGHRRRKFGAAAEIEGTRGGEKGGRGGAMICPMASAFTRGDQRRQRKRTRSGTGGQSREAAARPAVSSACVAEE